MPSPAIAVFIAAIPVALSVHTLVADVVRADTAIASDNAAVPIPA